jgi:hypothetical protein
MIQEGYSPWLKSVVIRSLQYSFMYASVRKADWVGTWEWDVIHWRRPAGASLLLAEVIADRPTSTGRKHGWISRVNIHPNRQETWGIEIDMLRWRLPRSLRTLARNDLWNGRAGCPSYNARGRKVGIGGKTLELQSEQQGQTMYARINPWIFLRR